MTHDDYMEQLVFKVEILLTEHSQALDRFDRAKATMVADGLAEMYLGIADKFSALLEELQR